MWKKGSSASTKKKPSGIKAGKRTRTHEKYLQKEHCSTSHETLLLPTSLQVAIYAGKTPCFYTSDDSPKSWEESWKFKTIRINILWTCLVENLLQEQIDNMTNISRLKRKPFRWDIPQEKLFSGIVHVRIACLKKKFCWPDDMSLKKESF